MILCVCVCVGRLDDPIKTNISQDKTRIVSSPNLTTSKMSSKLYVLIELALDKASIDFFKLPCQLDSSSFCLSDRVSPFPLKPLYLLVGIVNHKGFLMNDGVSILYAVKKGCDVMMML